MASADVLQALIGASPGPGGLEKQAAIADILRRKGAFGFVGQISGDPMLAQVGQGMQQEAGREAAMAQQASQSANEMAFARERQAQDQANAQTGFALQSRGLDLQQRGQALDAAEAAGRIAAAKDAARVQATKLTDTQAAARAYLGRMQAAGERMSTSKYEPNTTDYAAGEYLYGNSGPLSG